MKLFIYTILLLAVTGIWGMPMDSEEDENDFGERKYGVGFDVGGSYKAGAEVGVHASNGTYSLFAEKAAKGRANAGIGVYKSVKPYEPKSGQETSEYDSQYAAPPPQYPVPLNQYPVPAPYPQPVYQYPVPGPYPQPNQQFQFYSQYPFQPYPPNLQYGYQVPNQSQVKQ